MMPTAQPVAYVRRSARSRSDPGDISREFQVDKVRELAGPDAARLRIVDADWGRSAATDKTDKRLAFLALLDEIEHGEVSALYAYATDRLARSVEWSARLLNACRRAKVPVITSEGRFDPGDGMASQLFYFQAIQNEGYSTQAQAKREASVKKLRDHGVKLGPTFYGSKPGEDLAAVLDAFERFGSAHAAARFLNGAAVHGQQREPVPTRRGVPWTHGSIRQILVREGLIAPLKERGAKPRAPFILYRLLRCPCGGLLSGVVQPTGGQPNRVIYRCIVGSADPGHAVKSIAEAKLLPAIQAEAARLRPPSEIDLASGETEREIERMRGERSNVIDYGVRGRITDDEVDRRLAAIDAKLADLAVRARSEAQVAFLVDIDWSGPPQAVNAVLRALWADVRLGPDLLPLPDGFGWRVPEWRT